MTSAAEPATVGPVDWRIIVYGGAKLGVVTAVGVAVFAFLSRGMDGTVESIVQSLLVLAGGAVFAYVPAMMFRPTDVDSIAWASLIGLMGALFFTVIDTAIFRPIDLYHWTWDAVGGGSGFWYIPVWWMGSAFLAWLGGWVVANSGESAAIPPVAGQTVGIGVVVSAILIVVGIIPFTAAGVALGFTLGLILHVPVSSMLRKE